MVRKGACGGDYGDVREEILSSIKESEKSNKSKWGNPTNNNIKFYLEIKM